MAIALAENSIQLVPDGTIFFHIALIILMVYALNQTLFRPINLILNERERRTKGGLGSAQNILNKVRENLGHYENSMRNARVESYKFLEQARSDGLAKRQNQLDALRGELGNVIEQQKIAIGHQSEEAHTKLHHDAQQFALEIAHQILHRGETVDPSPTTRF